jgi:hypothetical protein
MLPQHSFFSEKGQANEKGQGKQEDQRGRRREHSSHICVVAIVSASLKEFGKFSEPTIETVADQTVFRWS